MRDVPQRSRKYPRADPAIKVRVMARLFVGLRMRKAHRKSDIWVSDLSAVIHTNGIIKA
jgi:hypothetical protein